MDTPFGAIAQASDSGTGSKAGVSTPIRAIEPTPSGRQSCRGAAAGEDGRANGSATIPRAETPKNCRRFIRNVLRSPAPVRPTRCSTTLDWCASAIVPTRQRPQRLGDGRASGTASQESRGTCLFRTALLASSRWARILVQRASRPVAPGCSLSKTQPQISKIAACEGEAALSSQTLLCGPFRHYSCLASTSARTPLGEDHCSAITEVRDRQ